MSSGRTFDINNICIFIYSRFFNEKEGVDVDVLFFNKVIELFCGKTTCDTKYYLKQIIFFTCLEGSFKL